MMQERIVPVMIWVVFVVAARRDSVATPPVVLGRFSEETGGETVNSCKH